MGSLPPAKAGVGSAMNDTTRQMGGALGVAIIGSMFASVFRPGIADRLAEAGVSPSSSPRPRTPSAARCRSPASCRRQVGAARRLRRQDPSSSTACSTALVVAAFAGPRRRGRRLRLPAGPRPRRPRRASPRPSDDARRRPGVARLRRGRERARARRGRRRRSARGATDGRRPRPGEGVAADRRDGCPPDGRAGRELSWPQTATHPAAARPPAQRGGDQAILAATLDLLAMDGYGGLTMAAVIARSGVSSATLYRRWPTKQQLVAAAVASLHAEPSSTSTPGRSRVTCPPSPGASPRRCPSQRDDVAESVLVELRRNPEFRRRSTRSSSCRGWP